MLKSFLYTILFITVLQLTSCGVKKSMKFQPQIQLSQVKEVLDIQTDSFRLVNHNFLQKNKYNNWELKVSGSPEEIGYYSGLLTQDLYQYQEKAFFDNLQTTIPSKFKQKFLIAFLRWYNREMYQHIPDTYLKEIYTLSQFSSEQYNWIAPKFQRALFLHGAHDIGHAMQDLAIVGCSSLAVWDKNTTNGDLLIGRNFDFYAGDTFAENKLVQFIKPSQGVAFASVSWPGMIGVVSGMNIKGITVTLNAAKSDIPLKAKKPVSIVARQILQQAETIDEAIAIAKSSEVFVSESLLIGSANENRAVVIEISPNKFDVYTPQQDFLICTNHFQSPAYKDDIRNQEHLKNSHTEYRFQVIEKNLDQHLVWSPEKLAQLLRSTEGLTSDNIGLGNEKALNQLIAHHAVIFEPKKLKMWVSSSPYQLGAMVCYDLDQIFNSENTSNVLFDDAQTIVSDSTFINTHYESYKKYRVEKKEIEYFLKSDNFPTEQKLIDFINLNPDLWKVYDLVGQIQFKKGFYTVAKENFEKALSCEIPYETDRNRIQKQLKKTNKKL